ncbi:carboxymuconolactone decarboxylase family protein [Undibacterium sp. TJN25]|uniref:carboxymuconolactone decarboxylase family protein n=1 Tax=Undibacterium sp. TJN25 TaxID=3413056 RepID=UPI003BF08ACF
MNRLYTQPANEAEGHAAQLYAAIKGAIGMVPNTYVGIGSNSPSSLEAGLHLDAVLKKSSLSGQEIEAIKLAASQVAECEYCLAAHTAISKLHGLSPEAIVALRRGQASGNLKLDALAAFTRVLVNGKGSVPDAALQAVRDAGYTDAQIVDTTLAISSITFTNLFNRINNTPLDFPAAA